MQVASRVWVVWGIMVAAPAQIASGGITVVPLGQHSIQLNLVSLLLAWSVTEIVRYSFFAFKVTVSGVSGCQPTDPIAALHCTKGCETSSNRIHPTLWSCCT